MNHKQKQIVNVKGLGNELRKRLKKSKECKLVGVGVFHLAKVKTRIGTNPNTHKKMTIKGHTRIKFRASKSLKKAFN